MMNDQVGLKIYPALNERGFTLVEAIVAGGLLCIGALLITGAMASFYSNFGHTQSKSAQEKQLTNLISKIQIEAAKLNLNFDTSKTMDKDVTTFPFYWSNDVDFLSETECLKVYTQIKKCPLIGRLNYMVSPISDQPGLFDVLIYISHPQLSAGAVFEYKYVLAVK